MKLDHVSALLAATLFGLVSILGIVMAGCGEPAPVAQTQNVETVQRLRTEAVQLQTVRDEIEVSGSVIASVTAQLAARITGTVIQVIAREGDVVHRGQLLAQIDASELIARKDSARAALLAASAGIEEATRAVAMAQAQADIAQKTFDRYVYLRDQKSVSPQEFDEVEAKQRGAQAALDQAKARLQQSRAGESQAESEARAAEEVASYARIVAPFDGRISRRTVEPGSLITPGIPMFIVEEASRYQLEVMLPADAVTAAAPAAPIRSGSLAKVEFDDLPGKSFAGRVVEIESGIDPASHTARARIDLPVDPSVRSGLFGRARFSRGNRRAIVMPNGALSMRGQLHGLYVKDSNGIARWRVVTVGQKIGDGVEILSGLSESELVVVSPGSQDLDGTKIVVSTDDKGGGQIR